jgi:Prokaryotic ubiquitin-like protein UBact
VLSFEWIFVSSFVLRHLLCGLPFQHLLLNFFMPERTQKPVEPAPWGPKQGDGGGPRSPDVSRPDTKDLLKKMRKVDPNQSKRYRQRTGE